MHSWPDRLLTVASNHRMHASIRPPSINGNLISCIFISRLLIRRFMRQLLIKLPPYSDFVDASFASVSIEKQIFVLSSAFTHSTNLFFPFPSNISIPNPQSLYTTLPRHHHFTTPSLNTTIPQLHSMEHFQCQTPLHQLHY